MSRKCNTCKCHCYDYSPNQFYCDNASSEKAGQITTDDDFCDEWEAKDE